MSHYRLGLFRFLIKSIFKHGVVFNIVRPYTEKEMHSLNESGGQILKIVPNISTDNLPRYSASYQGYRDFETNKETKNRAPTTGELKECYIQIIKVQCRAVMEMYQGPGQLKRTDKFYLKESGETS